MRSYSHCIRIFCLPAALAFAAPSHAQTRTPAPAKASAAVPGGAKLRIEDVLRWKIASSPAISPEGQRIAFLLAENDFELSRTVRHLWLVDTETRQTRRLTQTDDGAGDPRWSPDGRWLAFLSARGSQTEGARGQRPAQVWLLPLGGGESFLLTHAPEGVQQFRWAPDGSAVYFTAREPWPQAAAALREQSRRRKSDTTTQDADRRRVELWRARLDSRKAERVFAGDPGLSALEPSPDGKWVAYLSTGTGDPDDSHKTELYLLELATGRSRALTRRAGEERGPVWSPDSSRIAFLAPRMAGIRQSQAEIFQVPLAATAGPAGPASGLPEPQRLTKDFSGGIERLHWPAQGDAIYFAAAVRTGNRLFRVSLSEGVVKPASGETLFFTAPDWTPDGATCAALVEAPGALPEIALLRPAELLVEPVKLTDLNPALKQFAVAPQEVVRWKSKDGMEIEGLLTRPPDAAPGEKLPLLLRIHGGPFARRAATLSDSADVQAWAARGWLVLEPNFRGSSAYGHEFGIASRGDIGGKDFDDVLAGVDYAIAQAGADPNRLAAAGGSYGGYMTNLLIARTQRFQAATSLYGIFNLITDFSNSDFPGWERDYMTKFYWEDLAAYVDRSAMKDAARITTPVLILHGEEDNNTFLANSREMYQALKAQGRTVKFVRFPREGHGFREPNHRIEQFRLMAAWLEQHVPGFAAPKTLASGEGVRSGSWELQISAIRTPESYGGVRAKGQFVEIELLLRATSPVEGRFSLLLFDNVGGDVELSTPEKILYPEGLVTETLGQRLLAKAASQVAAIVSGTDGSHSTLAVTIAFDAPPGAREFVLKVKDFPPVRMELPVDVPR